MNEKWIEVMELAEKYGFIWFCYGGVAVLATPEEQTKVKKARKKRTKKTIQPQYIT